MASSKSDAYCVCGKSYKKGQFMIECGVCKDWFHGSCVIIPEHCASFIDEYHCPRCKESHGPLTLKADRMLCLANDTDYESKAQTKVRTGSKEFIELLKKKVFRSATELPIVSLRGCEATTDYLDREGFDVPILVDKKDGLDLTVPEKMCTVYEIENYVGSMQEIDVIDVAKQQDTKMFFRQWADYYNSTERCRVLNLVSLEVSNTKMANMVDPPRLVKEISWVNNCWPTDEDDATFIKPEVQRYCLMGVKDSYTDFHIDFGGSSVWYHIVRGAKIFYLIPPSPKNLALYEEWMLSSYQSETFFADLVDVCYSCTISEGQTVFIPSGWIHSVFTPVDSLVFGGNYLHNYNIMLQLKVYEIEKNINTPQKYYFPNFEPLHWFAAKNIMERIRDDREGKMDVPSYLIEGSKILISHLRDWTKVENVPYGISHKKLLRDLEKELDKLQPTASDSAIQKSQIAEHSYCSKRMMECDRLKMKKKKIKWNQQVFVKK